MTYIAWILDDMYIGMGERCFVLCSMFLQLHVNTCVKWKPVARNRKVDASWHCFIIRFYVIFSGPTGLTVYFNCGFVTGMLNGLCALQTRVWPNVPWTRVNWLSSVTLNLLYIVPNLTLDCLVVWTVLTCWVFGCVSFIVNDENIQHSMCYLKNSAQHHRCT